MKRVLYFFPLNPAERNSGSCTRALGLLNYFKDRGFHVDFVSKKVWGGWTIGTEKKFRKLGLADQLHIFSRKPVKKNPLTYFFRYKIWHLLFEKKLGLIKGSFPNHTTLYIRQQFDRLFKKNSYDYIIISYAYWADVIRDNSLIKNATTIIDTHDLLYLQHQGDKVFDNEAAQADEIKRLSLFDQVWAISLEETDFLSGYLKEKVKYIPVSVETPPGNNIGEKGFDLVYVATDNPHNLFASRWFFENVYPLLPKTLTICVIGTIIPNIPQNLKNVTYTDFVADLNDMYARSKVAICPMFSGTGVKVKVIEALANGLPVVCNERGLDGLPDKIDNGCLVTNDARQFAENISILLQNPDLYNKLSMQGIALFERNFTRESVYKKLDEAFGISEN